MAIQIEVAPGRLIARRKCVPAVETHTLISTSKKLSRLPARDEFSDLEDFLAEDPAILDRHISPWGMNSLLKIPVDEVLEILNGLWPVVQPLPGHDLVGHYKLGVLLDVIDALRFMRDGGEWRPLPPTALGGAA